MRFIRYVLVIHLKIYINMSMLLSITPADILSKRFFPLYFFFFATWLPAQVSSFKKTYGTAGDEEASFLYVFPDNTFFVAGSTTQGNHGGKDAMLVKFDAAGDIVWANTYGGNQHDVFKRILPCSDGSLIALGETRSYGAGGQDLYLVNFTPDGSVIWAMTCGGENDEAISGGICEMPDGYVISGATRSYGAGYWDIYVVKIDLNGNFLWSKSWGTVGGDGGGEPFLAENGEIWLSGWIYLSAQNHDGILLRLKQDGTLLGSTRFGSPDDNGNEYSTRSVSGFATSSSSWIFSNGFVQQHPWLLYYSLEGELAWCKSYRIPDGNFLINAEMCPDGGFIFTPYHNGADVEEAYLVKTDPFGEVQWSYSYRFNSSGNMFHALPCPDGGYLAVGHRNGEGKDIFLLKTNPNGLTPNCRPEFRDIRAADFPAHRIQFSPDEVNAGGIFSLGAEDHAISLFETDICFHSNTGVFQPEQAGASLRLYPVPASDFLRITTLETSQVLFINLFDLTGKKQLEETIENNDHLDVSALSAGYYLITAQAKDGRVFQDKFIKN